MTEDTRPTPLVRLLGMLFLFALIACAGMMAIALSRVAWTTPKNLDPKTQWQTSEEPSQK